MWDLKNISKETISANELAFKENTANKSNDETDFTNSEVKFWTVKATANYFVSQFNSAISAFWNAISFKTINFTSILGTGNIVAGLIGTNTGNNTPNPIVINGCTFYGSQSSKSVLVGNSVVGTNSNVIGHNSHGEGNKVTVFGNDNTASTGSDSVVIGQSNNLQNYIECVILGNGGTATNSNQVIIASKIAGVFKNFRLNLASMTTDLALTPPTQNGRMIVDTDLKPVWTNLAMHTNFINVGQGYQVLQIRKVLDKVQIRGFVKRIAVGTTDTIITLTGVNIPSAHIYKTYLDDNGVATGVAALSNGEIRVYLALNRQIYLDLEFSTL